MYDRAIRILHDGVMCFCYTILVVDGSKNLDSFTANVLARITVPVLAIVVLIIAKGIIESSYGENEDANWLIELAW